MSTHRVLAAKLVTDLGPSFGPWLDVVAFGVGMDGSIYAAARQREGILEDTGGGVLRKTPPEGILFMVLGWKEGKLQKLVQERQPLDVSFVQPYPGGILLAAARCPRRPEGAERNAVALDWKGLELRRLTLGDGIQDIRVAGDGMIWTSYFDEGVFGNYGWGRPGPEPIGASGLVAFTQQGKVQWSYDSDAAGTDSICDAYAMNVAGDDDVWLYFYTEFPIVRITGGEYRAWKFGVGGARAIAIRDKRVVLSGDYNRLGLARIVDLREDGTAVVQEEVTIEDEGGGPMEGARVCGVGSRLFFLKDRQAFVVEDW
jgi:hypothetical protein